eukprot:scaffold9414_cov156-Isochrysis_galbana.AAC.7
MALDGAVWAPVRRGRRPMPWLAVRPTVRWRVWRPHPAAPLEIGLVPGQPVAQRREVQPRRTARRGWGDRPLRGGLQVDLRPELVQPGPPLPWLPNGGGQVLQLLHPSLLGDTEGGLPVCPAKRQRPQHAMSLDGRGEFDDTVGELQLTRGVVTQPEREGGFTIVGQGVKLVSGLLQQGVHLSCHALLSRVAL